MKKIVIWGLFLLIITAAIAGTFYGLYRVYKGRANTQLPKKTVSAEEEKAKRKQRQEALIETIKEIFNRESPATSFSLGVYDLKHKEYFGYNDTIAIHAASVSKVLTAVVLLDKVDKGEMKLSDPLGAYNVEFQLEKMISISNQPSWDLIDAKLGLAPQETFAKERLGMSSVNMAANTVSVKDVVTLFTALAQGKVLTEALRDRLFTYMQNTESEDFFSPAFKNEALIFYHKTGKYLGEGHDAAIVKHTKNPFVVVLFTENNTTPNLIGRGVVMTKTAEAVLDYFDYL